LILAALAYGAALYIANVSGSRVTGVLEIVSTGSGNLHGRWPLEDSGEFTIEFMHSVNQSPVRETFRLQEGQFTLEYVRFYSFGAGLPFDLQAGQTLSRDGDAMIISGFDFSLREINLIVGTDHILFINNESISLKELCGQNAHITIRYR